MLGAIITTRSLSVKAANQTLKKNKSGKNAYFHFLPLQMFSDYQMQEMSENFIDSFGFQDDEFTESDMSVRSVS